MRAQATPPPPPRSLPMASLSPLVAFACNPATDRRSKTPWLPEVTTGEKESLPPEAYNDAAQGGTTKRTPGIKRGCEPKQRACACAVLYCCSAGNRSSGWSRSACNRTILCVYGGRIRLFVCYWINAQVIPSRLFSRDGSGAFPRRGEPVALLPRFACFRTCSFARGLEGIEGD
jgi:hypothetical protein